MNFLAHIYLSGESDQVKIGNFIGDFVKGQAYRDYPKLISRGILMHRNVDSYTDGNPVVKKTILFFRQKYGLYAGIVVDILYDHFLAVEWHQHALIDLQDFILAFYHVLENNFHFLPERVQSFTPRFIQLNWLATYHELSGVEKVLDRMSKRTSLPNETKYAMQIMEKNYFTFQDHFREFFPLVKQHVSNVFDLTY